MVMAMAKKKLKGTVVSLFDRSGHMLRPWAEAGYRCMMYDIENPLHKIEHRTGWLEGSLHWVYADLTNCGVLLSIAAMRPLFIASFPPCTDLAVSGAKHFAAKSKLNPKFQIEAAALAMAALRLSLLSGTVPWFVENPVGRLSTLWSKPDYYFHPYEYGGYLPADDQHPNWPDYIAPRDAYPKKTCIWSGGGFVMPPKRPVEIPDGYSQQFYKLGGKSEKTKMIRSETPRGFARAVFAANEPLVRALNAT